MSLTEWFELYDFNGSINSFNTHTSLWKWGNIFYKFDWYTEKINKKKELGNFKQRKHSSLK